MKENTSVEETVTITKREYEALLEANAWLSCLFATGVDNWQGISDAYEVFEEEYPEYA